MSLSQLSHLPASPLDPLPSQVLTEKAAFAALRRTWQPVANAAALPPGVRVLEEDRHMCELQVPREVPLNPTRGGWSVLVMPGDTLATTFQKQFRRWLLAGANP